MTPNIRGQRGRGPFVSLKSVASTGGATSDADGRWNVLAYETELKGRGTKLARADFEKMLGNFARYPKVPVTIEHADTDGGPTEWAEPHGWITDLRIGSMERRGATVATLEGKLHLDEATRPKVNADPPTWPFGSVTIVRNARDDETAEELGALLWSFTLTAHPALVDMPRLAASRPLDPDIDAGANEAERQQAIRVGDLGDQLREALAAPDADVEEILRRVRELIQRAPRIADNDTMSRGRAAEEKAMIKFLELAASFGLAAANEDDARAKVLSLAAEAPDVRKALSLPTAATSADVAAKLSGALADAARVPALVLEVDAFRKERDVAQAKERAAHIDGVMLARHLPDDLRASLEFHARSDWDGFQKAYPMPTGTELAERRRDEARLSRPVPRTGVAAPASAGAGPGARDLLAGVDAIMKAAAEKGVRLSFSEACAEFEGQDPSLARADHAVSDDADDADNAA